MLFSILNIINIKNNPDKFKKFTMHSQLSCIIKLERTKEIGILRSIGGAIILVVISVVLTMIAGLIPAKFVAKRDPVESLRTE